MAGGGGFDPSAWPWAAGATGVLLLLGFVAIFPFTFREWWLRVFSTFGPYARPLKLFVYRGEGTVPRNAVRVEVHRSVMEIPDELFIGCTLLESLLLHDGLLRIGDGAFMGCSSLRSVRSPATVTEIGVYAFYGCSRLVEVVLLDGLEEIEFGTFWECTSLDEVQIPASVARIGYEAFGACTNLVSINLREGLRWIGMRAFYGCSSLERLSLPSSVEEVKYRAFDNCVNLALVRLHEDLGRIEPRAFGGCTSLERFQFTRLSERMEAVALDEQTASVFEGRFNEIVNAMVGEADNRWEECKGRLRRAHSVLAYWELKGATTTLELALWRNKIKEEGGRVEVIGNDQRMRDVSDVGGLERESNIDRETWQARQGCHVRCGADVVIPEVIKFFSYSTTWS